MAQQMTRARRRAWTRHAQREAARRRGRRHLAALVAGVFALGVGLGLLAGLSMPAPGPAGDAPQRAGTAPAGDERRVAARPDGTSHRPTAPADPQAADPQAADPLAADAHPPVARLRAPPPPSGEPVPKSEPTPKGEAAPKGEPLPEARAGDPGGETGGAPPAWRRHAVRPAGAGAGDGPRLAVVIDDLGLDRANAHAAIRLPAPLTLAFMTYAPRVESLAAEAREAGHELMVHVPMQPGDGGTDPGPRVLRADLPRAELLARLRWGLSRFTGYVGINNHMGSAFTADGGAMRTVLEELARRGLLFLDSVTTAGSVGGRIAGELGMPHAARDIFLDNRRQPAAIRRQLAKAEALARRRGQAIAIGHPHEETIAVLRDWLPRARARGLRLVPVSAVADPGRDRRDIARLPR